MIFVEVLFATVVPVSLPTVDGIVVVATEHFRLVPPGTQLEISVPFVKVQFMKTVV